MEKCPVCNARLKRGTTCHRCKADLALLIQVEEEAVHQLAKARAFFEDGDFGRAQAHAKRSMGLKASAEAAGLLAAAAFFNRDFQQAVMMKRG